MIVWEAGDYTNDDSGQYNTSTWDPTRRPLSQEVAFNVQPHSHYRWAGWISCVLVQLIYFLFDVFKQNVHGGKYKRAVQRITREHTKTAKGENVSTSLPYISKWQ